LGFFSAIVFLEPLERRGGFRQKAAEFPHPCGLPVAAYVLQTPRGWNINAGEHWNDRYDHEQQL
jgi:hypothetical protein